MWLLRTGTSSTLPWDNLKRALASEGLFPARMAGPSGGVPSWALPRLAGATQTRACQNLRGCRRALAAIVALAQVRWAASAGPPARATLCFEPVA